jgi:hypothetical protein
MLPRYYAFLVMMGCWLLHLLIDWNDVEGMRVARARNLMRETAAIRRALKL